jgi:hypothetical protein
MINAGAENFILKARPADMVELAEQGVSLANRNGRLRIDGAHPVSLGNAM